MAPLTRKRATDFVLYVAISLLFVGIVLAFILSGVSEVPFLKWLFLFFASLGVFGFWIEQHRPAWKSKRFWYFTVTCFAVHLIFWSGVLWRVKEMNHVGWWLRIGTLIELCAIMVCWNFLNQMLRQTKPLERNCRL
jgi:hypothetical protein